MSFDNDAQVENKPKLAKRMIIISLLLIAIATPLALIKVFQFKALGAQSQQVPPPTSVTVATATEASWQSQIKAIGSLVAYQGIDITSEVDGIVRELNFESGQEIEQGELLLSLNNEVQVAALTSAKAQYESANNQYRRSLKLKDKNFVTENELDQQRWAVDAAKSQVESATADLNKKNIHAPFSGKLGIRSVDIGDYISPGAKLVTLQSVDTLYLDFTLPERNFTELKVGQPIEFSVRSYPEKLFKGELQAWDPNLDTNTRNVNVRAVVNNQQGLLAPGMFAEISVESTQSTEVLVIPETSIFYNIYGEAVYVLESASNQENEADTQQGDDYVLAARQIKVLYRKDGMAGVTEGIKVDEQVVTSGQLKLFPSMKVKVVDDLPDPDNKEAADADRVASN